MDLGLFVIFSLSVIILPSAIDVLTYSLRDANGHLKISAASMLLCVEIFKFIISWVVQQYNNAVSISTSEGKFSTPKKARGVVVSQEEDGKRLREDGENDRIGIGSPTTSADTHLHLTDFRSKEFWSLRAKYAAPACFYALQNNLCVKAMVYLNPPVFVVFMQGSFLITCVLEFFILRRRRNLNQLIALAIMVLGLIVVEIHNLMNNCGSWPELGPQRSAQTVKALRKQKEDIEHLFLGIVYVLIVMFSSGISGVVVEYLFRNSDVSVDMWQKNIWLYGWGVWVNFLMWSWDNFTQVLSNASGGNAHPNNANVIRDSSSTSGVSLSSSTTNASDSSTTFWDSFFVGWDPMVVMVMILRTMDGVLISIVFAKLGVTLKNVGKVVQVVLIAAVACIFLNVSLHLNYYVGACLAMLGVWLFMSNQDSCIDSAEDMTSDRKIDRKLARGEGEEAIGESDNESEEFAIK